MGYKNFSEICPIFNTDNDSGVEKEVSCANYYGSSTISAPVWGFKPGREITVMEAFANIYTSTTAFACVSTSCTINIYSDQSLSTQIGSIALGSADMTARASLAQVTASGHVCQPASLISTALTSTDMLAFANSTFAQAGQGSTARIQLIVRYREK